jgi:hypothetical protein
VPEGPSKHARMRMQHPVEILTHLNRSLSQLAVQANFARCDAPDELCEGL